jgi:hypothetical protein
MPPFSYLVICHDNIVRGIYSLNMFRTPEFRAQNGIRALIEIDNLEIEIRELTENIQLNLRLTQEPTTPFDFDQFIENYEQDWEEPEPIFTDNGNLYTDLEDVPLDDSDWGYRSD